MNVAVVLGVSDYGGHNDLPGCKNDAQLVSAILDATKKYEEVVILTEDMNSYQVKMKLVSFFEKYQNKSINEIFFYFSGHGDFFENEFYFLLSDYTDGKRKTTCLQNKEVDEWLKSLNPKVTIKFVDACHSGVTYVKDNNLFKTYLQEQQKHFNMCYFMFSSKVDQVSYQKDGISDFTKSFAEAIKKHPGPHIRYKDIIDYISDDFEANYNQTPFFVIQADFMQQFGSIMEEDKKHIFELPLIEKGADKFELVDKIKAASEKFCTKQEIYDIYSNLMKLDFRFNQLFDTLYDVSWSWEHDSSKMPKVSSVGRWLNDNTHSLLASPEWSIGDDWNDIVVGFNLNMEDLPFEYLFVKASSKFPILLDYALVLIPIFSKTHCRFFYFMTHYDEGEWDSRTLNQDVVWKTLEIETKPFDTFYKRFQNIVLAFGDYVIKAAKDKFQEDISSNEDTEAS